MKVTKNKRETLQASDKITIRCFLDHAEIKHWILAFITASFIFVIGVAFSESGLYKNAKRFLSQKEIVLINAAGSLILECNNKKPAMLGVLHEQSGSFVFSPPGGKSENDENESDTAIRETREETGYVIKPLKLLGNAQKGNINFSLVLAEIDYSKPSNSHYSEISGLLWANPKDIPIYDWRFPEQKEWIVKLFEENAPVECP